MKALVLLLQMAVCSGALQAQVPDTTGIRDTSRIPEAAVTDARLPVRQSVLLLPPLLQPEGRFELMLGLDGHPGFTPLLKGGSFLPKTDLLASYRLQRQRENELRTLKSILGAVQLGGAAYLAYRYIKKHGFK